jgi:hypothetical protein
MLRTVLCSLVLTTLFSSRLPGAEAGRQDDDGRIVFAVQDGRMTGSSYQSSWDYKPTRWGMYEVSLSYANAGPAGTEVAITCGQTKVTGTLATTGSADREATLSLGPMYVADTQPRVLTVRCTRQADGAGVHLKTVTLEPACEGKPPVQADDGVVTLHGRDATVLGTTLRYEPAEKKQTLGYWTRPTDAATWSFTLARPGTFDVEVLQGCGPGQGGSVMTVAVDPAHDPTQTEHPPKPLEFIVEATGGFQDFRPRIIGRVGPLPAGQHTLRIAPKQIAKQAACDIRQVRLVPVSSGP